jgi:hypothetical protein
LPTHWIIPQSNSGYSYLKLKSSLLTSEENAKFSLHGGGSAWADGLWRVEDATVTRAYHLEANSIEIAARIGIVRIYRPWLNGPAMKIAKQFADLLHEEASATSLLVPMAFVTAHDIQIKGDFTAKDREQLEQSLSGSKGVTLGPLRLSGQYAHSLSSALFHATETQGTITIPGIQILAWISEVVPASVTGAAAR